MLNLLKPPWPSHPEDSPAAGKLNIKTEAGFGFGV